MILSSHGIIGSSIVQFVPDADYQAVLDYATTQGYTLPSAGQQVKQNKLLVDLKDAGVWSKLDSFAVFATDGNSNFALIDWKRLSQYTAVNSPTFTTNQGFNGNGSSSYLNTNYNPTVNAVKFLQNNASFGVWRRILDTTVGGGSGEMGLYQSTPLVVTRMSVSRGYNLSGFNDDSGGGDPSSSINSTGLISMNRVNSTTYNFYDNGVLHQQITKSTTGLPNLNFYIFGHNFNGSFIQPNKSQFSMVYVGENLTNEQSNFTSIFDTYLTSL
jgi:hypothetical protein